MLLKLRSYLFLFLAILSLILYWPIPVVMQFFVSEQTIYYIAIFWGRIVLFLLKYVLGISYRITGKENVPDKPCVALSKHQSALDIFVLLSIFEPHTSPFKKELLKMPCFGWMVASTNPIAIDRKAGRQALNILVKKGIEKLQKGIWVLIYPEGTRTLPGQKSRYKSGGVLLAKKAGVDIVPVALNTGLFWQKHKGILNNGVIDIVIGKPIATDNKDVKTLTNEVGEWIEENSLAITLNHPYYLTMQQEKLTQK